MPISVGGTKYLEEVVVRAFGWDTVEVDLTYVDENNDNPYFGHHSFKFGHKSPQRLARYIQCMQKSGDATMEPWLALAVGWTAHIEWRLHHD